MANFIQDTIHTFLTKVIVFFLGLACSIVIARILGPEGKGIYTLVILLPSFLIAFTNLGISTATTYYTAHKDFLISEIFANNIIFSIFTSVASVLIGLGIILFSPSDFIPRVALPYLFLGLLTIPFSLFSLNLKNIFLGLQQIKKINFFDILQALVGLVFIIILVWILKMGVFGAILGYLFDGLFLCLLLFIALVMTVGNISFRPNWNYLKKTITYGIKAHISSILAFLNYRIDVFIVNWFLNPLSVGLYALASGISEQLWILSYSVNFVLSPRLAAEKDEAQKNMFTPLICRSVLFITLIGALVIYFIAPWLIGFLYSAKFLASIEPCRILLLAMIPLTIWRTLAIDFFARGRPELNIYINLLAASVNIALNFILIPKVGICGAAWASVASYSFASLNALLVYRKITGNSLYTVLFPQPGDWQIYRSLIGFSWLKKTEK